jgi:hypothetical protein
MPVEASRRPRPAVLDLPRRQEGGRGRPGAALVSRLDRGLALTDSPARALAFGTVQEAVAAGAHGVARR